MDQITILQSDTDDIPRGAGTMGSRSLQTAGSAVHIASETVLGKAKELAAHLLEASADDIVVGDGGLQVAGVPTSAMSWADLAQAANDDAKRPDGMDPGLAHELDFDGTDSTFPFGSHISLVEVDTETGNVTMLRHVAVENVLGVLQHLERMSDAPLVGAEDFLHCEDQAIADGFLCLVNLWNRAKTLLGVLAPLGAA